MSLSVSRTCCAAFLALALMASGVSPATAARTESTLTVRATVVDGCAVKSEASELQVDAACGGTRTTRQVVQPSSSSAVAAPAGGSAPVGVTTDDTGGINYLTVVY